MRLPEQRLWDTMRANKPRGFVLERVENIVTDGMPDVYVMAPAVATWVELKAPNPPKREATRVLGDEGLRQSQKNWHIRASRLALPTWILIRERETGRLWLMAGYHADIINDMTADELDRGASARSWPEIFEALER
jgi:hypothetical protein